MPHLAPALPDALMASLPGVDPNDTGKTVATLAFVHAVLSHVPLVDAADAAPSPDAVKAVALADKDLDAGLAALADLARSAG